MKETVKVEEKVGLGGRTDEQRKQMATLEKRNKCLADIVKMFDGMTLADIDEILYGVRKSISCCKISTK